MTRKQAISTVLGYLDKQPGLSPDLCKAILILKEMQNGIPGKIWTDEAIREAIERFMEEHGRPPKVKELDTVEYLPPHSVVARQYGMTAGKWLEKNYPGPKGSLPGRYKGLTPEDLREMFISEYQRIQPVSEEDFDQRRRKGVPCWHYIAKQLRVSRWNELRRLCGLMPKTGRDGERVFLVDGHVLEVEHQKK